MPGRRNDAFIAIAHRRRWSEVYEKIGRGEAGVDDYDGVCTARSRPTATRKCSVGVRVESQEASEPMHGQALRGHPPQAHTLATHGETSRSHVAPRRVPIAEWLDGPPLGSAPRLRGSDRRAGAAGRQRRCDIGFREKRAAAPLPPFSPPP